MAMLTVRALPDDVHRALRVRAIAHGRSTEAEVRAILTSAVKPPTRVLMGDALSALGQQLNLQNKDFDELAQFRDKTIVEPLSFT